MNARLTYRDPLGTPLEAKAVETNGEDSTLRPPLEARPLRLELPDGSASEVRCVRPVPFGTGELTAGYLQLDNEIMAGIRLARLCAGGAYPREISRLVGYESDSPEPFALLEPLRGAVVAEYAGAMMINERREFQTSLLRAVRWLGAAGLAHRGISPETVRWDGERVQITDFSQATLIGAPRTVAGAPPWQAPEQRADSGKVTGRVGPTDDMWAVGRLIFHVVTGDDLDDLAKLHNHHELASLLEGIIGAPETRPRAQTVLGRMSAADAPPRSLAPDPLFERGRAEFFKQRERKHPDTAVKTSPPPVPRPDPGVSARPEPGPSLPSGQLLLWAALTLLIVVAVLLSLAG